MPNTSWKSYERRVAAYFPGARRRGPGTGDGRRGGGKSDILADGYSIETKLLGRAGYADLLSACRQAEENAESPSDIPLAIVKVKKLPDCDSLVCLRLAVFSQYFIGGDGENDE